LFAFGALIFRRVQMNVARLETVAVRKGISGLLAHLFTTTVISGALAEVVALTGLALSLLGGDSTHVIRLGIVALAVSIYNYPRRSAWRKAVDYFAAALSHQQ